LDARYLILKDPLVIGAGGYGAKHLQCRAVTALKRPSAGRWPADKV